MFEIPLEKLPQIIQVMTCISFVCIVVITLCILVIASIHSSINNKLEKILEEIIRLNGKNS